MRATFRILLVALVVLTALSDQAWAQTGSSNQTSTAENTPRTPRRPRRSIPADDKDCSDFKTQAEAQRFFNAHKAGDPHRLDPDRDGIACPRLPKGTSGGKKALPETGSDAQRVGIEASVFLAAGLAMLFIARRRQLALQRAPAALVTPVEPIEPVEPVQPIDERPPPLVGW